MIDLGRSFSLRGCSLVGVDLGCSLSESLSRALRKGRDRTSFCAIIDFIQSVAWSVVSGGM
jgi:hypothetical protein